MFRKLKQVCNTHHRVPKRLGGGDFIEGLPNTITVPVHLHRAFHHFFNGCDSVEDMVNRLSSWIDPRYEISVQRRA